MNWTTEVHGGRAEQAVNTVLMSLDDLLTWIPCRIVMVTLPLVAQPWSRWTELVRAAEHDGAPDPSPNAGRSEASFAHCAGIRLGGRNRYGAKWVDKPILV